MRRKFSLCAGALTLALVLGASPGVEAAPITGSITFGGGFTPTGGGGTLATATGVDITGDIATVSCAISNSCTGTYAVVTGLVGATYNDFDFAPLSAPSPLWTFTHLGVTYSFDLSTVNIVTQNNTALVLTGTGILSATGFDDTFGEWSFSGDTSGGLLAFSATNSVPVVPEPASVLLLGLGLLGGSAAMRRRVRLNR